MNFRQEALVEHFSRVHDYLSQAVVNGWYQPDVLNKLSEEVEQIQPSQAYLDHLDRSVSDFVDALLASPKFHQMRANWAKLDPQTEQRAYLQECVDRLATLQGRAGIKVSAGRIVYYNCDDPEIATDAYVAFNKITHLRDMDDIGLNEARPARMQNLLLALQSVTHEQTHLFNLSLNSAYFHREIDESHPMYEEACYFRNYFLEDARVQSNFGEYADPKHNPYLSQLDERAAFHCGDSLYERLREKLDVHPRLDIQPAYASGLPGMRVH